MPEIKRNLGDTDRLVRMVIGLTLLVIGMLFAMPTVWMWVVWLVAAEMMITAAVGY